MAPRHGTYYVADGTRAQFSDALAAWVPFAHELLLETATTYNRTTTYKELTELVQERSGIRTTMLIGNWSGKLLEQVAQRAADAGEPPLTSLCVHQDGTIGDGYRTAPKSVSVEADADDEDIAAHHRLLCYRAYAADLPADGGLPQLTHQVAQRRSRLTKKQDRPRTVCPLHHIELPAAGVCAECE